MTNVLSMEQLDALDRMDRLGVCWAALSDLMNPDGDLQERQRDNLAVLTGFLAQEYDLAREQFSELLHSPAPEAEEDPDTHETEPMSGGNSVKRRF